MNALVHPEFPVCLIAQRNIGEATDKMGWVSSPQEKLASRLGTLVPEGDIWEWGAKCVWDKEAFKNDALGKVVSLKKFLMHPCYV